MSRRRRRRRRDSCEPDPTSVPSFLFYKGTSRCADDGRWLQYTQVGSLSSHTSQSPAVFCLLLVSGLKPSNRQAGKHSPDILILPGYYMVLMPVSPTNLSGPPPGVNHARQILSTVINSITRLPPLLSTHPCRLPPLERWRPPRPTRGSETSPPRLPLVPPHDLQCSPSLALLGAPN